jgi:lysophospholipase L1-like esterase
MKRLLFFGLLLFVARVSCGDVFKDGETVCFLGDSITHGGRFHSLVYDYYLTRYPERTIRFVNAGVSGDSAGGALGRLTEDVTDKKPTSVAVMFGMNDVNRGSYVAEPDAQKKAAQQGAFDGYKKNMEILVGRIRAEAGEPRLYFITPSPFDQTAVNDRNNNQPGCNDGLGRCAEAVKALAVKNHATVVDFHTPMTAFNLEHQKGDPAYTIIGPDRVHPGAPGHLMMAWLFLKSQGAPALVSKIVFDAAAGKVAESDNATVTEVAKKEGAWGFTVLEKALPFPVDEGAKTLLAQLPIEQDLDQETVAVKGLTADKNDLLIDGTVVGQYTADELSKGINLALNASTPQYKQALAVAKLNESRRATESMLRNYAAVRWFLKHRQVNPDDLDAVKVFAETKMNKTGYYEGQVGHYLTNWSKRGEVTAKVAGLEQQLFAARKPVAHVYVVRPVQ